MDELEEQWWELDRESLAQHLAEEGLPPQRIENYVTALTEAVATRPKLRRMLEVIALNSMLETEGDE